MQHKTVWWRAGLVLLAGCALVPSASAAGCPNDALRSGSAAALPDCRAYELVSPVAKAGSDVIVDTSRFRISTQEGSAVPMAALFASLGGFGDVRGSGVAVEYLAARSLAAGTQGWVTHAVTPLQKPLSFTAISNSRDPLYVGDGDASLTRLVFKAWSPLGPAPNVAAQENLYLRNDLRTAGGGSYQLLSDAFATLGPDALTNSRRVPQMAGASADLSHVLFESVYPLTADAPASTASSKLYEAVDGVVRLVGILPPSQGGGPAPRSIAGQGAGSVDGNPRTVPHVISQDGSRVFFTVPVDDAGSTGALYMRDDHGTLDTGDDSTVQVNVSERTNGQDSAQPATYWDAAVDGSRVFFTTTQSLTNDAPIGNVDKLYMYDANKPASDPHNLTYVSADHEPADGLGPVFGVLGAGGDGRTVYFLQMGQVVAGQPALGQGTGIFAWREGAGVQYVGQMGDLNDTNGDLGGWNHLAGKQLGAVVSADGRFLLLSLRRAPWPGGFDHGDCHDATAGCSELYLYDSVSGAHPVCVSCGGVAAPSSPAFFATVVGDGGAEVSTHLNAPLTQDGSEVFFTTAESLVPEDRNGKDDVYEWSRADGAVHLISSGQSPDDSFFLDATPDGHDVFFATRERLSGWDVDSNMDVYDARVDGGVPDPVSVPVCAGDACKGPSGGAPPGLVAGSSVLNLPPLKHVTKRVVKKRVVRCRRGLVRRRVHGRVRCVKPARRAAVRRGGSR